MTGGAFFNHVSSPYGDLALAREGPSLDSCFGHSSWDGCYHYHANINCTHAGAAEGATDPDTCLLIGYMVDGFPVYGFCRNSTGMQMTSCYTLKQVSKFSVETAGGTYSGIGQVEDDYYYDEVGGTMNRDCLNFYFDYRKLSVRALATWTLHQV